MINPAQQAATRAKHRIETKINNRLNLFVSGVTIPPPENSKSGNSYTVYIPGRGEELKLADGLGFLGGTIKYTLINSKEAELSSYSFHFIHAHSFHRFYEGDEELEKERFNFHLDYDKDHQSKYLHPLVHFQIAPLSLPRFPAAEETDALLAFEEFLNLVEMSFYKSHELSKRSAKLECAQKYLTQYQ
jgi:hypothetical protein